MELKVQRAAQPRGDVDGDGQRLSSACLQPSQGWAWPGGGRGRSNDRDPAADDDDGGAARQEDALTSQLHRFGVTFKLGSGV